MRSLNKLLKTNGLRNSSSSIWGLKFIRNDELTERMATVSSGFRQFSWTKDKETMLSCDEQVESN